MTVPSAPSLPSSIPSTRARPKLRIGVLDLLSDAAPQSLGESIYARHFRTQFTSITPQAVSVWCRRMGHEVTYAAYCGDRTPESLLPDEMDYLFVCAYTKAAPLAYALARRYGKEGVRTVLGGPHARSFPDDALRFFDWVVGDCDQQLVADLLDGQYPRSVACSSGRNLVDFPSVEERMPELERSSLRREGRTFWRSIPLLASVGCPYTCDFCVDWDSTYVRIEDDHLRRDLEYIADHHPDVVLGFHDPNFAIQFDATMRVLESIEPERRLPYVMESSLSVLKDDRLPRLRDTRCAYIAAGIESWQEYSGKAGAGRSNGPEKLHSVSQRFEKLRDHVYGFQGNFVLGTDADQGPEPAQLTKQFIREHPYVWPGINIPTPFGGTPLFDQLRSEGRLLETMPFLFYYNPYLVFRPKHYGVLEYYEMLDDVFREMNTAGAWARRLTNGTHWIVKAIHSVQAAGAWSERSEFRRIARLLRRDPDLLAFHEGERRELPAFYRRRFDQRLGRYADLLDEADRTPDLRAGAFPRIDWVRGGAAPEPGSAGQSVAAAGAGAQDLVALGVASAPA